MNLNPSLTWLCPNLKINNMIMFSEDKHEYSYEGRKVAGVTAILKSMGIVDFKNIPDEVLERALKFGIAVHKGCELEDKHNLEWDTLDPALKPYIYGWIMFKKQWNFEIEKIEHIVFSKKYWFAGRLDRVGILNGKRAIVDIKTGVTDSATAIQTAGYSIAYNEGKSVKDKVRGRVGIFLKGDGEYRMEVYNDKKDESIFLSALTIYNWRIKNGK